MEKYKRDIPDHENNAIKYTYAAIDLMRSKYPKLPFIIYDESDAVDRIRRQAIKQHLKNANFKTAEYIQDKIEGDEEKVDIESHRAYEIYGVLGSDDVDKANEELSALSQDFAGIVIDVIPEVIQENGEWRGLLEFTGKLDFPQRFIVTTILFK